MVVGWPHGLVINLTVDPIVAHLGPVALGWGSLFTILALLLGGTRFLAAGRRAGLDRALLERAIGWALVGALVGGRVVFVLAHARSFWAEPRAVPAVWQGGMALDGALVGGLVALLIVGRDRLPIRFLLDRALPATLAGLALGWMGPFLTGSDVGRATGGSWGVIYWHPDALVPPALLGVPTQPHALYAAGWCLLLLAGVELGRSRRHRAGDVFLAGGAGLALGQFVLAFARPDQSGLLWSLTGAQLQALGLAAAVVASWGVAGRAGRIRARRPGATAPEWLAQP